MTTSAKICNDLGTTIEQLRALVRTLENIKSEVAQVENLMSQLADHLGLPGIERATTANRNVAINVETRLRAVEAVTVEKDQVSEF